MNGPLSCMLPDNTDNIIVPHNKYLQTKKYKKKNAYIPTRF